MFRGVGGGNLAAVSANGRIGSRPAVLIHRLWAGAFTKLTSSGIGPCISTKRCGVSWARSIYQQARVALITMAYLSRKIILPALAIGTIIGAGVLAALIWRSPATDYLVVSGNIEAHESVLSFKTVQSPIVELPFDEGQWVQAGTLLARVEDRDYRQQIAVDEAALSVQKQQLAYAQKNLEAARRTVAIDQADFWQKSVDYERYEKLWQKSVVSTQVRDLAETAYRQSRAALTRDQALEAAAEENVKVAQAAINSAEQTLKLAKIVESYTRLYAPFSGVLLVRNAELGETVQPGTPVFTLADLDHLWLRAYINETDLGRVRLGQAALVTTDSYPGQKYVGRISMIAENAEFTPKSVETHAERVTLVYRIKIDILNQSHELKPGMPADATIKLLPSGQR
jgi:HlyD family secretion protein